VDERFDDVPASDDEAFWETQDEGGNEPGRAPAPPLSPKLLRSRPPKPRSARLPTRVSDVVGAQRPNKLTVGKVRIASRRSGK
jgi:hypothetical protein